MGTGARAGRARARGRLRGVPARGQETWEKEGERRKEKKEKKKRKGKGKKGGGEKKRGKKKSLRMHGSWVKDVFAASGGNLG